MNGLELLIYFFLVGASMMLVLLGLVVSILIPAIDRWSKRFFEAYFTVLMLYTVCILLEGIFELYPVPVKLLEVDYYFETLFVSVLMPMITACLLHCCGEKWQRSPLFRLVTALWFAFFIMMDAAPFTTLIYYLDSANRFYRGSLYSTMMALLEAILVLNVATVIRWRDRMSRRYYYAFLVGLIPMAIAVFIHIFINAFTLFGISLSLSTLSMFIIILSDQIEQTLRQQQEIAHQRASIMVLQMRPHFIYNTMMSIYYLCKQDPDLAQRVTLDFTTYLRQNFTAIASDEPIPFSEELEHTRAYLAVEQAQFEDRLFVSFDTPHVDFKLPPLTLQPIVENAVKHGMDPDSEPLSITIRTRRTESGSEITVENNGMDYVPADDNEPHIALKNMRQRLEMMCHGQMAITPRSGGGTIVKVTVP